MNVQTDTRARAPQPQLVLEFLLVRRSLDRARTRSATRADTAPTRQRYGRRRRTVAQPVKVDNALYVRDYAKCIVCYKCVEACGTDAQNTFAIAVAGRGFGARISTEFDVPLPDSACVYCGNCIGVCPTGALMFSCEHDLRARGRWDEIAQTTDRHDLLRTAASAARSRCTCRRTHRQGDLADRKRVRERPPLHQGPLRLPTYRTAPRTRS